MEYYFCNDFCTYFFIIFTLVLHLLKGCPFPYILQKNPHENRSGESRITACQTLCGSKSKVAESISWKLNSFDCIGMKKGVECAVRLGQWRFLELLILTPPLFNNVYLNNPAVDF